MAPAMDPHRPLLFPPALGRGGKNRSTKNRNRVSPDNGRTDLPEALTKTREYPRTPPSHALDVAEPVHRWIVAVKQQRGRNNLR